MASHSESPERPDVSLTSKSIESEFGEVFWRTAQNTAYEYLKQVIAGVPRNRQVYITEEEVTSALGLSRTPIREAMGRLARERLLDRIPGRGTMVPKLSDDDVLRLLEARALLESWAGTLLAIQPQDPTVDLRGHLRQQQTLTNDPAAFLVSDRQFHHAIVGSAGNALLTEFYEMQRNRQARVGLQVLLQVEGRARTVLDEHQAIVEAIANHDAIATIRATSAHLEATLRVLGIHGDHMLINPFRAAHMEGLAK